MVFLINDIAKELNLYKWREIEIQDLYLRADELEIGDSIAPINYGERVQTSGGNSGNERLMIKIENLRKLAKSYTIKNKRIDNALLTLDEEMRKIVTMVFIEKLSYSEVARRLAYDRRTIKKKSCNGLIKLSETWKKLYLR